MFCPDGFITLYEVVGALDFIAIDRQRRVPEQRADPKNEHDSEHKIFIDTDIENEQETNAYREWLLSRFLVRQWNNLYACSSHGVVLRLAREVTEATRVYYGPFPEDKEGQEQLIDHLLFGLNYVNNTTLQIEPAKSTFNYNEYGEDLVASMLRPLAGWPVCWKPPKIEMTNDDLHQVCLSEMNSDVKLGAVVVTDTRRPRGRPRSGDGIIELALQREFSRRLDNGKLPLDQREATYVDAIDWVNLIFQQNISRSTIQRYLSPVFSKMDAQK